MVAATSRWGSRVAASDITTNAIWPGLSFRTPVDLGRMRQPGGKMLDTRTRLQAAMSADRNASSNEVSFSRCLPTPLVKNSSLGTSSITWLCRGGVAGDQGCRRNPTERPKRSIRT